MCGICGFWQPANSADDALRRLAQAMALQIEYRGPDDAGEWVDETAGVGLSFRRLAIVDLSPLGHQPMTSASGRYEIIYNGEVYNFVALREELTQRGHRFRGGSDTEVILAAVEEWGLRDAVQRFVGMFGIALWDRQRRELHLVRDRLGIKPIYYGWQNGVFMFGSELKALAVHPAFRGEIDRDALTLFMRFAYVPDPFSIYQGIAKLPPGSILTLRSHDDQAAQPQAYWSAQEVAAHGQANPFTGSPTEAVSRLDALLREAVALRMVADVPLGAFLSGGVDSSTVVALMQAQSDRPVKTFTIGFNEPGYNEADHAAAVAAHLQTDHTELTVTPQEAQAVIPRLPAMFDEPFADSSQIPTFLVSQLARQRVTVSLSGDGGDELFGGYNRYQWGEGIWKRISWAPAPARTLGAKALRSVSPETWDSGFARFGSLLPTALQQRTPGDKLHKLADALDAQSQADLYLHLVSQWREPAITVPGGREPLTILQDDTRWPSLPGFSERMMFLDLVTYLPGDILTKVDRASMAISLEARVPLLDHRVVEFAASLPLSLKVRDGQGKWILRQVLDTYVPRTLIERPKMGFGVPIDQWLRGPLREWADDLLDPAQMRSDGYLNPIPVRERWEQHLAGSNNWQHPLWCALQFQAWHAEARRASVQEPVLA
ncbi:MAG: asparagine synthase (glutamine-hydrolyzing) [Thermomicrobiales bacterium]